jgi:hypothetical protein
MSHTCFVARRFTTEAGCHSTPEQKSIIFTHSKSNKSRSNQKEESVGERRGTVAINESAQRADGERFVEDLHQNV